GRRRGRDHDGQESGLPDGQPAPMPWSVFLADGGIAFHSGDPKRASAGCIHLAPADAQAGFENLQIGDQVQVVKASEEAAARSAPAESTDKPASKGDDDKSSKGDDDKSSKDDGDKSDSDD